MKGHREEEEKVKGCREEEEKGRRDVGRRKRK